MMKKAHPNGKTVSKEDKCATNSELFKSKRYKVTGHVITNLTVKMTVELATNMGDDGKEECTKGWDASVIHCHTKSTCDN